MESIIKEINKLIPKHLTNEVLKAKVFRKQVRYWCFRYKNEIQNGSKATGSPRGLRKNFEENENFLGWDLFNESKGWDVGKDEPLEMKPLKFGSDELWNKHLKKTLPEVPVKKTEKKSKFKNIFKK